MQFPIKLRHTMLMAAAAGVSAVLSTGVAADAHQRGADRFPIDIAKAEARAAERHARIDDDGDGVITLAEFEQAEIHRGHKRHGKRRMHRAGPRGQDRAAMREAVRSEMFTLLDADGDGSVSRDEYDAADKQTRQLARKRAMFKQLDADGDGIVAQDELPDPVARLKQADRDGDGLVTRDEFRAARATAG